MTDVNTRDGRPVHLRQPKMCRWASIDLTQLAGRRIEGEVEAGTVISECGECLDTPGAYWGEHLRRPKHLLVHGDGAQP